MGCTDTLAGASFGEFRSTGPVSFCGSILSSFGFRGSTSQKGFTRPVCGKRPRTYPACRPWAGVYFDASTCSPLRLLWVSDWSQPVQPCTSLVAFSHQLRQCWCTGRRLVTIRLFLLPFLRRGSIDYHLDFVWAGPVRHLARQERRLQSVGDSVDDPSLSVFLARTSRIE
jgi:hypothetical protein